MVLVDTSVWIDFLKGEESPEGKKLEELLEEEKDIFTTGIIVQEILSGIKEKKLRKEIKEDLERLVLIMPSLDTHISAAEIYDKCRKKGFNIRSGSDCLIAALAIEYDIGLLQKDRDFKFIAEVHPLKLQEIE